MSLFSPPVLIKGQIEGLRLRTRRKDRTWYTIINFEIGGTTMEMVGDTMPTYGDHDPVPPPFVIGDAAVVAARPVGDGLFKVVRMIVPHREFIYGNTSFSYRILCSFLVFVSPIIMWSEYIGAIPFTAALVVDSILLLTIAGFGLLALASSKRRARFMILEATQ